MQKVKVFPKGNNQGVSSLSTKNAIQSAYLPSDNKANHYFGGKYWPSEQYRLYNILMFADSETLKVSDRPRMI